MKYLFAGILILNAFFAVAEDGVVKTPFWKAPVANEITSFGFSPQLGELESSCEEFKTRTKYMSFPMDASTYSRQRKVDSNGTNGKFEAKFYFSDWTKTLSQASSSPNILPFYNQERSSTFAYLDSTTTINLAPTDSSFTTLTKKLKLTASEYELTFDGMKFVLVVYGKDLACDLLNQMVKVEVLTPANVVLEREQFNELQAFYINKIQTDLTEVLYQKPQESISVKMLRFGFRFGRHVEDMTEEQVSNLMELLFLPGTLKPTRALLEDKTAKSVAIQVPSSVIVPSVKVNLKFKENL